MELFVSYSEIMHYFKRNRARFLIVVLAFGIVGGLLPLKFIHPVYHANTVFTMTCGIPDGVDSDYYLQYTNIVYSRVQSAMAMASEESLKAETAAKVGVDKSEITNIAAEQEGSAPVLKLTLGTTNAGKAARLSDTAAQLLIGDLKKQFPSPALSADISDPAPEVEAKSRKSSMVKAGFLGLVLGFLVYVCYGILAVLSDKTVRNSRSVEETLRIPLLAQIPRDRKERQGALRSLRSAALHQAGEAKSFLFADVCERNGAAESAAGFASSLAKAGKRVLLVDADLRGQKLAGLLGVQAEHTLNDVLAGSCSLGEAAVPVEAAGGLSLLCGAQSPDVFPADVFAGGAFEKLVGEALGRYDYVVFCAPAEIRYPDAESLAGLVKSVVLSVRYGSTPFRDLRESCGRLAAAGGRVIGFVTTGA